MDVLEFVTDCLPVFCQILSKGNELTSFLNVWIIASDRVASDGSGAAILNVHPILSSTLYACLETIISKLLLRWPYLSRIQLISIGPMHVWLLSSSILAHINLSRHWKTSAENVPVTTSTKTQDLEKAPVQPSSTPDDETFSRKRRKQHQAVLALLPALVSAALMNASLILFTQSFSAPSVRDELHLLDYLALFSLLLYLGCRYADVMLCKALQRPGSFKGLFRFSLDSPLFCLPLLLIVRSCVRLTFGLSPFMGLHTPDAVEAEALFGLHHFKKQEGSTTARLFASASPYFSLLGTALMVCGHRYFVSSFDEQEDST